MRKFFIIQIIILILVITGEIKCIIKFCNCSFKGPTYKAEIIYGVSIVTGIGAIMGWVDIKDN